MNFKKTTIALAAASVLSIGFASSVNAGVLATSIIEIENLTFTDAQGNALDFDTDFTLPPAYTTTADSTAALGAIVDASGSLVGPNIDDQVRCVGTCAAIVDNVFPVVTSPPVATYAAADQLEFGAPVLNAPDGSGGVLALGATVSSATYVSLAGGDIDGSSTGNNQMGSSFRFNLAGSGAVTMSFDAQSYLEAFISADEFAPANATADYSVYFRITDLTAGGVTVFDWNPNGTIAPSSTDVGVNNEVDAFSLNDNLALNAPFGGFGMDVGLQRTGLGDAGCLAALAGSDIGKNCGAFSATTNALTAGTLYQLDARIESNADARTVIPEPASIALMGLGLLGLAGGAASRRRRKTA